MIDSDTALAFSLFENKGVYALLLGSGVSRAAQVPTGWDITLDLTRRLAALRGVSDLPDWAVWYKEQFSKEPSYSELLDSLSSTPDERRSILHSYIEPTEDDIAEGRKVPTGAHHCIARMVAAGYIRVIITTNFDRLMENALREAGVEPTVIRSDDDLKGAVPLAHSRCYVVKVHGDYLDTRIRNTDRELSTYSKPLNALLDRIIDEHGMVVCGWSAEWDPALRAAIARAPNRRYPLFWAARGRLSSAAEDLMKHRDGKVISVDSADAFFEKLERMVFAQADLQAPNPRTTELLVVSTKKYLGRPEFRIPLDELIGTEVRILSRTIDGADFDSSGTWSPERYTSLVARYEAAVEPLARIFGVLGRWGTGEEFPEICRIIGQFGYRQPASGLVVLIGLRTYPGVLLLYAYGLGLLTARRHGELFQLYAWELDTGRDERTALVAQLLLGAWEGMQQETWKVLPGLENHKTALSDHLHDLFSVWSHDYVFTAGEFTETFEEFELLGSLAYLSVTLSKETLHDVLQSQMHGQNLTFAPMGRVAWDSQVRDKLLRKWERAEIKQLLLRAGFAQSDNAFLADAIENLKRLGARYRWM